LRRRLEPVEIVHDQIPFALMEINKIADPGPDRVARMRYLGIRAQSRVNTGQLCEPKIGWLRL
jgi:hypothetical protein